MVRKIIKGPVLVVRNISGGGERVLPITQSLATELHKRIPRGSFTIASGTEASTSYRDGRQPRVISLVIRD